MTPSSYTHNYCVFYATTVILQKVEAPICFVRVWLSGFCVRPGSDSITNAGWDVIAPDTHCPALDKMITRTRGRKREWPGVGRSLATYACPVQSGLSCPHKNNIHAHYKKWPLVSKWLSRPIFDHTKLVVQCGSAK
jgi:hypothetical protein